MDPVRSWVDNFNKYFPIRFITKPKRCMRLCKTHTHPVYESKCEETSLILQSPLNKLLYHSGCSHTRCEGDAE